MECARWTSVNQKRLHDEASAGLAAAELLGRRTLKQAVDVAADTIWQIVTPSWRVGRWLATGC